MEILFLELQMKVTCMAIILVLFLITRNRVIQEYIIRVGGGGHHVIEATFSAGVEYNLLSEFVNSSKGQIYMGAKTYYIEPSSEQRKNIASLALKQVGEGYDNNWSTQKGPAEDEWSCVGLTEKVYESADTPDELQYHESYNCYCGTGTYALDITHDEIDNDNNCENGSNPFAKEVEKSGGVGKLFDIFFPYTQYIQNTLINVITDYSVSDDFHTFTTPSKTTVSQGGIFGPFTVKEINNSDFYYGFNVQAYVTKPDGTKVDFAKLSTGLNAGEPRTHYHYLPIPSGSELGTFTFGVKITDTDGNLIDDDSFEFTVVSSTAYASKRSDRKMKRLMRNQETQVVEGEGWKVVIVPERNR
jgi:hypothetical protein